MWSCSAARGLQLRSSARQDCEAIDVVVCSHRLTGSSLPSYSSEAASSGHQRSLSFASSRHERSGKSALRLRAPGQRNPLLGRVSPGSTSKLNASHETSVSRGTTRRQGAVVAEWQRSDSHADSAVPSSLSSVLDELPPLEEYLSSLRLDDAESAAGVGTATGNRRLSPGSEEQGDTQWQGGWEAELLGRLRRRSWEFEDLSGALQVTRRAGRQGNSSAVAAKRQRGTALVVGKDAKKTVLKATAKQLPPSIVSGSPEGRQGAGDSTAPAFTGQSGEGTGSLESRLVPAFPRETGDSGLDSATSTGTTTGPALSSPSPLAPASDLPPPPSTAPSTRPPEYSCPSELSPSVTFSSTLAYLWPQQGPPRVVARSHALPVPRGTSMKETGLSEVPCPACSGRGYCRCACAGVGSEAVPLDEGLSCGLCSGTKKVPCEGCQGRRVVFTSLQELVQLMQAPKRTVVGPTDSLSGPSMGQRDPSAAAAAGLKSEQGLAQSLARKDLLVESLVDQEMQRRKGTATAAGSAGSRNPTKGGKERSSQRVQEGVLLAREGEQRGGEASVPASDMRSGGGEAGGEVGVGGVQGKMRTKMSVEGGVRKHGRGRKSPLTEEEQERMTAAKREKRHVFSAIARRRFDDPGVWASMKAAMERGYAEKNAPLKISRAMKLYYADEENRRKKSELMTGRPYFCKACGTEGHRRNRCPELGFVPKGNSKGRCLRQDPAALPRNGVEKSQETELQLDLGRGIPGECGESPDVFIDVTERSPSGFREENVTPIAGISGNSIVTSGRKPNPRSTSCISSSTDTSSNSSSISSTSPQAGLPSGADVAAAPFTSRAYQAPASEAVPSVGGHLTLRTSGNELLEAQAHSPLPASQAQHAAPSMGSTWRDASVPSFTKPAEALDGHSKQAESLASALIAEGCASALDPSWFPREEGEEEGEEMQEVGKMDAEAIGESSAIPYQHRCRLCREVGHNRRTCRMRYVTVTAE